MLVVKKLNFSGLASPLSFSRALKLIVRPSTLGGVPVFILPVTKPAFFKDSEIPYAADSPDRPPLNFLSPTWIFPFKKVPFVSITHLAPILIPREVATPVILFLFIIKNVIRNLYCL